MTTGMEPSANPPSSQGLAKPNASRGQSVENIEGELSEIAPFYVAATAVVKTGRTPPRPMQLSMQVPP